MCVVISYSVLDPRRLERELEELINRSTLAAKSREEKIVVAGSGCGDKTKAVSKVSSSTRASQPSKHGTVSSGSQAGKCNPAVQEVRVTIKKEGINEAAVAQAPTNASAEERVRSFINEHQNQRTSKTYATGWAGFTSYLAKANVSVEEITAAHIADYLGSRWRDEGKTASTICGDKAAIAHRLKQLNKHKLMKDQLVVKTMNLVRQKANQSKSKRHVSAELMAEMISHHEAKVGRSKSLIDAWRTERNICLMLFMMMGMLRESEATGLKAADVAIRTEVVKGEEREMVALLIRQSKTDQAGVGAVVLLDSNTEQPSHCPVARMKAYVKAAAAASMSGLEPMFPTEQGTFMKPSTPCGIIQRAIQAVNEEWSSSSSREFYWGNPKEYGSHSLRRGGVTTARENGVPMLDIQRHGRWKGLSVFDYVGLSTEDKLTVSGKFLANVASSVPAPIPNKDSSIPTKSTHLLVKASLKNVKVKGNESNKVNTRKRKASPNQGVGEVAASSLNSGLKFVGEVEPTSNLHLVMPEPMKKKSKVESLLRKVPATVRGMSVSSWMGEQLNGTVGLQEAVTVDPDAM